MSFFNIWKSEEQKKCARYLQILKYAFLIFKKVMSEKIVSEILQVCFFLIFEKVIRKKTVPRTFRIVSMLFSIFQKAMRKKLCQVFRDSEVRFFNIWKSQEQKNCSRYFQIRKCPFSIFEKARSKKNVPGICRFWSMLF